MPKCDFNKLDFRNQQEIFISSNLRFMLSNTRFIFNSFTVYLTKIIYIQKIKFGITKTYIQKHSTEQKIWSVSCRLEIYSRSFQNVFTHH